MDIVVTAKKVDGNMIVDSFQTQTYHDTGAYLDSVDDYIQMLRDEDDGSKDFIFIYDEGSTESGRLYIDDEYSCDVWMQEKETDNE